MKNTVLHKKTWLPLIFLAIFSCEKQPAEPSVSEKLQNVLETNLEVFQGKGISAAVDFSNGVIWSGESGISVETKAISHDMDFCIGSVTKTFIAALCLQLADENVLRLEEPISNWLPAYRYIDSSTTIKQLLHNTSGIYNLSDNAELWNTIFEVPDKKWTPDELIESFLLEPYAAPGEGWFYSNTNYILLGEIISRATGTNVSYQLRSRFFEPLRLDHT